MASSTTLSSKGRHHRGRLRRARLRPGLGGGPVAVTIVDRRDHAEGRPLSEPFRDQDDVAVIGRHAAVFAVGRWQMEGFLAWLAWAAVHVLLLVNFEKRMRIGIQWAWRCLAHQRGARNTEEGSA